MHMQTAVICDRSQRPEETPASVKAQRSSTRVLHSWHYSKPTHQRAVVGSVVGDYARFEQLPSYRHENIVDTLCSCAFKERRRAIECTRELTGFTYQCDRAVPWSVVEVARQDCGVIADIVQKLLRLRGVVPHIERVVILQCHYHRLAPELRRDEELTSVVLRDLEWPP